MIHRKALGAVVGVFLIAMALMFAASCAKVDPIIASGNALDAVGGAFLSVAKAYDQALDQKVITTAQYLSWKKVGLEIQRDYGPAVAAWIAATNINDAVKITEAKAKVAAIVAQLTQFGLVVGVRVADMVQVK